jgi:hypothetical protein
MVRLCLLVSYGCGYKIAVYGLWFMVYYRILVIGAWSCTDGYVFVMEILVTKLRFMVTVLSLLWICFCYGNIGYKITVGPPNRGVGKGLKKKEECPSPCLKINIYLCVYL